MIIAHIMGIPVEESIPQLAPIGAVTLTAVAVVGRTWLGDLGHRLRRGSQTAARFITAAWGVLVHSPRGPVR